MGREEGEGVLNPSLYRRLRRVFGKVHVARRGEPMQFQYRRGALRRGGRMQLHPVPGGQGESYCVNCPICRDSEGKCYVNHRYDVPDRYGSRNLWLVQCMRRNCFYKNPENRRIFYEMLGASPRSPRIRKAPKPKTSPGSFRPAGEVAPLSSLSPGHLALEYLRRSRGVDPLSLEREWGVGWIDSSPYVFARRRIYIPVLCGGEPVFWQARLPSSDVPKGVPKYWTMPGALKTQHLYNADAAFEFARRFNVLVVAEGPTDVWSIGPPGVACFGKDGLYAQAKRIVDRVSDDCLIVVLLDPDLPKRAKGVHHSDRFCEALAVQGADPGRILDLRLPSGTDPGSFSREELWRGHIVRLAQRRKDAAPLVERAAEVVLSARGFDGES